MASPDVSILRLEELVVNAWPAAHTLLYDGWVLRFAGGYTRRANSIHPLYDSTVDLETKVSVCESLYRQAGLQTVFKLTRTSIPASLDERLAECGYRREAETSVQVASLEARPRTGLASHVSAAPSPAWINEFCRMSAIEAHRRPLLMRILERIHLPCGFAVLEDSGEAVACGLAVVQGEWLGLYNIVTDPKRRGRGHGGQIVDDLLNWGSRQGVRSAYLGVMQDNAPALSVYARAGFHELYTYWYRVQS
jgi:ribosomal protein S18 acetylase RimI-like enzyme